MAKIVVKYGDDHPEKLNNGAAYIVVNALRQAFPCPFAFDLSNCGMMAFAGLWDAWKDPANGQWVQSYTIITTEANELMAPVHDRMPVILHPGDFNRWLDREHTDKPPIDLLRPFPADEMETFEVSKDVGNVKNNSPELLNSK